MNATLMILPLDLLLIYIGLYRYEALRLWHKTLTSADSEYRVQLAPGTVLAFDNSRALHGRSAFTGKRHMCGAYVGSDDWRSRLEVLSERYGKPLVAEGLDPRLAEGERLALERGRQGAAGEGQAKTSGYEGRTWGGRI